jgi:hypothetical protein
MAGTFTGRHIPVSYLRRTSGATSVPLARSGKFNSRRAEAHFHGAARHPPGTQMRTASWQGTPKRSGQASMCGERP